MKQSILVISFLTFCCSFSQSNKETVYLIFNPKNNEKCEVNVEQTIQNKNGIEIIKKYRKEVNENEIVFNICDEKFLFNSNEQKNDTLVAGSLNVLNIKDIRYLKDKYHSEGDFKHHVFEQINIIEKISDNKVVKYLNVYWCCEWAIE